MSGFKIAGCTDIEAEGLLLISEALERIYPSTTVRPVNGNNETSKSLQMNYGDLIWFSNDKTKTTDVAFIEAKVERRYTGNFFIETWSNWTHDPRRLNHGCMVKTMAHHLCYCFMDKRACYMMNRKLTLDYVFSSHDKYPETTQRRHAQMNVTRGLLVPVTEIEAMLEEAGRPVQYIELPMPENATAAPPMGFFGKYGQVSHGSKR